MSAYVALLERSYEETKSFGQDRDMGRLEYLADYIFDFTTYDSEIAALFATKALEVARSINDGATWAYFEGNPENYKWFLLMVNMPFFQGRLEWGTSIRGAWWVHEDTELDSCGLVDAKGEQVLLTKFNREQWREFIAAMSSFAATP